MGSSGHKVDFTVEGDNKAEACRAAFDMLLQKAEEHQTQHQSNVKCDGAKEILEALITKE